MKIANAIRTISSYGPESAFYRSLGFIIDSERKRPKRTGGVALATTTANAA